MNPESIYSHPSEKDVFLDAMDIGDAAERNAFLEKACNGDSDFRERVEALLRTNGEESEKFLNPDTYESLREGRETFAEVLGREGAFLSGLGDRIRILGDYELLEEVGRGAMGVVFRARQRSLNREVALKVILGSALASEADRKRFHVEAEAAAQLEHPNIVPIYEIGLFEDHDYFSMPLIRGGTLGARMAKGRLPMREAVSLILRVATGVQVAHQRGILHRDLKPDNILLDEQGEPHVSDFGLASRLEQESTLTISGQIMGTPQYMAPEQADAGTRRITTAADIYSLGAILYELLAGVAAFRGKSVLRTLQAVREMAPRSLRLLDKGIDHDLDTIVLKCLEKKPAARYDSASALADDLRCWLEGRPISARPPSTAERLLKWARRRPVHAALVGVAALFLITLGIGGPLVAIRQTVLRKEADLARIEAVKQRKKALRSAELAERQGRANRRLAYASNMRLVALAEEFGQKDSIAPEAMIAAWLPAKDESDVRGWEWYFNFAKSHRDTRRIRVGGSVRSLDFSPFGERLVIGTSNGTEVRDGLTGTLIRKSSAKQNVRKVAWSPSGEMLASINDKGGIRIEAARSARVLGRFSTDPPLLDFSWSPSDERMATLNREGGLALWKISENGSFTLETEVKSRRPRLSEIAWSPDGSHIAAIGEVGDVLVWVSSDISIEPDVYKGHTGRLNDLAWHRGGTMLATACEEGSVRVWGVPGGTRIMRIVPKTGDKVSGPVRAVAWRPQGQSLVYAVEGINTVRAVNLANGTEDALKPVWTHDGHPQALAWSAEAQSVAVGGSDGQLTLGRADTPEPVVTLIESGTPLDSVRWNADGDEVSCIDEDGFLRSFSLSGRGRPAFQIKPFEPGDSFAWHKGGPEIAMASNGPEGTRISIIDPKPNGVVHTQEIPDFRATDIIWPRGRGSVILAGENGRVMRQDLNDRHSPFIYQNKNEGASPAMRHLAASPDDQYLLATGDHGSIAVWSIHGGELLFEHEGTENNKVAEIPCWQPSGEHFATAAHTGEVTIWSLESKSPERVIKAHRGGMGAMAWHPQGDRLATAGSTDSTVRVWDWEMGEPVLTLTGMSGDITALAWSPDGRRLAATSSKGVLRTWDASAGILLGRLNPGGVE